MPAVFVHGVPDTPALWSPLIDYLDRDDIVLPQLPGFGTGVPNGFDATKEAYVDWLAAQIEAVGEPVDLVGHDWGSLLVQRVASTRPDLIRTWAAGAATVDPAYAWHEMATMWQTPDVGEQVMAAVTPEAMAVALAPEMGEDRANAVSEFVDATMKDCILKLYRSAVNVGQEWGPAVDKMERPGLVLWGRDDPFVTSNFGERLAQRTGAQLVMFDGTGHWWPVTRAEEAAGHLTEFWASA